MLEEGLAAWGGVWCWELSGGGGAEKGRGRGVGTQGPMEMMTNEVTAAEEGVITESKQSVSASVGMQKQSDSEGRPETLSKKREVTSRNQVQDSDSRGLKDLCFPEGKSGGTWFCDMGWLSRIVGSGLGLEHAVWICAEGAEGTIRI